MQTEEQVEITKVNENNSLIRPIPTSKETMEASIVEVDHHSSEEGTIQSNYLDADNNNDTNFFDVLVTTSDNPIFSIEEDITSLKMSTDSKNIVLARRAINSNSTIEEKLKVVQLESVDSRSNPSSQSTMSVDPPSAYIPEQTFDKTPYYHLYYMYNTQVEIEKQKNDLLHRQMGNYYKERKMFSVFVKEIKNVKKTENIYFKYLNEFTDLVDHLQSNQKNIQIENDSLSTKHNNLREEVNTLFRQLQQLEAEVGKEFLNNDPLQIDPKKMILDRCLKRQQMQLQNLQKMRLAYIKTKNKLQEKQDDLDALDNLGPNLRLMDYEQLKIDNRNLRDKLEEKETELIQIRAKCQHAMQILAHLREKETEINNDIENMEERLTTVSDEYNDVRQQLNFVVQDRDIIRRNIKKLEDKSGLLTTPKLLYDMEDKIQNINDLSQQLERIKVDYFFASDRVGKMRIFVNAIVKTKNSEERKLKIQTLCSPKPTLMINDDM